MRAHRILCASELLEFASAHCTHARRRCYTTNEEGAMADRIHMALTDGTSAVIINPGAWTHYSYGIRDALAILKCPIIEVRARCRQVFDWRPRHLRGIVKRAHAMTLPSTHASQVHMSNMHGREDLRGSKGEEIRQHSVVSPIAKVRSRYDDSSHARGRKRARGREGDRETLCRKGREQEGCWAVARTGRNASPLCPDSVAPRRAQGIVSGFGINSYLLGLRAAVNAAVRASS